MRLFVLLLLVPLIAASPFHYEIHGHLPSIKAEHLSKRSLEAAKADVVRQQIQTLIPEKFIYFALEKFEIHGEKVGRSSAIFYGYITASKEVDVSELKADKMEVFYFGKQEKLPELEPVPLDEDGISCVNGGLALPNSTCACPAFFTGDSCEKPICMNSGIVDGNRCACPPGHYSVNCEPRGCLPPIQDKFDNSKQTFILVLNQRSSMAYVMNFVITGMASTLNSMEQIYQARSNQVGLISNYVLVNYVYTSKYAYYMNKKSFRNQADFLNYLQGVNVIDAGSQQYTQRAIYTAQNFDPYMRGFSNIFVFTDATDMSGSAPVYQVSSTADEISAITQTIAWRNRIVYLISQMKGQPIDNSGNGYDTYRRVAAATLGDIISFDMLEIQNIMNGVIPFYQQNENILVSYGTNSTSFTIPPSDDSNSTLLVTVEPNAILPTITANAYLSSASNGSRYLIYLATPGTINVATTGVYSVRVYANSIKTAIVGYSTDPKIDLGSSYVPAEVAPYVSAGLLGLSGSFSYSMVDNAGTVSLPTDLNPAGSRSSTNGECSLPYALGRIKTALNPGNQWALLNFDSGYVRIIPAFAGSLDHHFSTPYNCFNGGTLTGPSACKCTDYFTGPNCGTPYCYNNGLVNPFPGNRQPLCLCKPGYSGDHCDLLACPITPGPNYNFGIERSLSVVLQTSMSQAWINANVLTGFTNIVNSLTGLDSFDMYHQTIFNNIVRNGQNETQILTKDYENSADFLYALQSDNLQYLATSSQTQDSFGALNKAITYIDYDKSSIFLFTDSPPSSTFTEYQIIDAAVSRQLEINIIITPPYGMSELCMSAGDVSLYRDIAQQTGGIILNLCASYGSYPTDPLLTFLNSYGPSHHHTENLNEILASGNSFMNFYVDNPQAQVFAFVNCNKENFTATLTDNDLNTTVPLAPIAAIPFIGIYRISPTLNNQNGYALNTVATGLTCSVRVSEKTPNAVYLGFSTNPGSDRDFTTLTYGVVSSIVAHPFAGSYLINASSVSVNVRLDSGFSPYNNFAVKRTNCQYDYYFTMPLICNQAYQTYIFTTTVTTSSGKFQRTQRGYCYQDQNGCLNGGTYDFDDYRCRCTSDYEGDFCENPVCQNGGSSTDFQCFCATGFTGPFCQYGQCDQWNFMETNDVRETDYKQLTFVLNMNLPQLIVNVQLDGILQNIVQNTESSATPTQYTLILFDENGYYDIVSTSHQQKFVDTFHNAINMVTRTTPTRTNALAAIYESYKLNIQPSNIVYVFTGTDTNLPSGNFFAVMAQKLGTQINFIYTPSDQAIPVVPSTGNFYALTKIARQTGGRVLPIQQYSAGGLAPVLISTVKEDAFIADDGMKDCSAGVQFYFFVESVFSRIVIEITGPGVSNQGNVRITDGNNANVTMSTMFSDTGSLILSLNSSLVQTAGGRWTANVQTTSGSCFIQARAQSPIRVIPGFTSTRTSDFVKDGPFGIYGTDPMTYMTFRVIDRNNMDTATTLTTLSIYHTQYYTSWAGDQGKIYGNFPILPRDPANCASQWMTSFQSDLFSSEKYVVTGTDANHVQFQRTFYFNQPNKTPDTTCSYGTRNTFGECLCDSQHQGNECSDRICGNGGSSSYGICACVNGYLGDYCCNYIIAANNTSPVLF